MSRAVSSFLLYILPPHTPLIVSSLYICHHHSVSFLSPPPPLRPDTPPPSASPIVESLSIRSQDLCVRAPLIGRRPPM